MQFTDTIDPNSYILLRVGVDEARVNALLDDAQLGDEGARSRLESNGFEYPPTSGDFHGRALRTVRLWVMKKPQLRCEVITERGESMIRVPVRSMVALKRFYLNAQSFENPSVFLTPFPLLRVTGSLRTWVHYETSISSRKKAVEIPVQDWRNWICERSEFGILRGVEEVYIFEKSSKRRVVIPHQYPSGVDGFYWNLCMGVETASFQLFPSSPSQSPAAPDAVKAPPGPLPGPDTSPEPAPATPEVRPIPQEAIRRGLKLLEAMSHGIEVEFEGCKWTMGEDGNLGVVMTSSVRGKILVTPLGDFKLSMIWEMGAKLPEVEWVGTMGTLALVKMQDERAERRAPK
jgi:hypothetical protein